MRLKCGVRVPVKMSQTILLVCLFAVAFGFVEASVVDYLRQAYYPEGFAFPLKPALMSQMVVELSREFATIVMLAAVGMIAGKSRWQRFSYFMIAFGVWDIFYYVFLKCICSWPRTLNDWDVLFLLPLPWWGPVLAPILIAFLMIFGGTLLSQYDCPERPLWPSRWPVVANCAGVFLALYVFMADALRLLPQGEDALRRLLPTYFNWPLFLVALVLMAVPIGELARRVWFPQEPGGGRLAGQIRESTQ